MARDDVPLYAFNRGIIDKRALARIDLRRTALSAEQQLNWLPAVLGSMILRPGWEYIRSTRNNQIVYHVPFIFSTTDYASLEFTNQKMRVDVNDAIVRRESVSTTILNSSFATSTGWTVADEGSATSSVGSGRMVLTGTGNAFAIRKQTVTVTANDANTQHAIRINVERGPLVLRIGSSDDADDVVSEQTLGKGVHSLAFTPEVSQLFIQLKGVVDREVIVNDIAIESSGDLELDTPYVEADLSLIRFQQSADVLYIACDGYAPYKIVRRGTRSWSFVEYQPEDGPFRNINTTSITLSPSARTGNIDLSASQNLFQQGHIGALFRITSLGQQFEADLNGQDQYTDPIRVTGVENDRIFNINVSGTWSGTVLLQRSVGEPGAWTDVETYTSATSKTFDDGFDNQIIYYRLGISTSYSSGTAVASLTYSGGTQVGIVRITGYSNETTVFAEVLLPLGTTNATSDWEEGQFSDFRGQPSGVELHEGRVTFGGKGGINMSVSDAFESYDSSVEGDSAPISRTLGKGPVDNINWLISLGKLIIGTDGAAWIMKSSNFEEPLTRTNNGLRERSTQGSARVAAVKLDDRAIYVEKSLQKLYQISQPENDTSYGEYQSFPLSELVPRLKRSGIKRIVVQRQPDTRIHCILNDGTVAVLISQPTEDVMCWVMIDTDGEIEDAYVLPGLEEDRVYYTVKRVIDGEDKRYIEKWALETECIGDTLNKQADSFIVYEGAATQTISGLDHLEGKNVVVWGDGKDLGSYDVINGQISGISSEVQNAIIGLPYTAKFESTKLAYASRKTTALTSVKQVKQIGLILADTHCRGMKYGRSFNQDETTGEYYDLFDIPEEINAPYDENRVYGDLDLRKEHFGGDWSSDERLCILGQAPRPCTLLAAVLDIQTSE